MINEWNSDGTYIQVACDLTKPIKHKTAVTWLLCTFEHAQYGTLNVTRLFHYWITLWKLPSINYSWFLWSNMTTTSFLKSVRLKSKIYLNTMKNKSHITLLKLNELNFVGVYTVHWMKNSRTFEIQMYVGKLFWYKGTDKKTKLGNKIRDWNYA